MIQTLREKKEELKANWSRLKLFSRYEENLVLFSCFFCNWVYGYLALVTAQTFEFNDASNLSKQRIVTTAAYV